MTCTSGRWVVALHVRCSQRPPIVKARAGGLQSDTEVKLPDYKMWVQKDTPRTKQAANALFFFLRIKFCHNEIVDGIELFFVLNGAKEGLTVLVLLGL